MRHAEVSRRIASTAVEQERFLIETRLNPLAELIAPEQWTPTVVQSLRGEETRTVSLTHGLARLKTLADTLSLDEKRIAPQLRRNLGHLPALFRHHGPLARQILRKLLDGPIRCRLSQ